jgi:hypothetical protein
MLELQSACHICEVGNPRHTLAVQDAYNITTLIAHWMKNTEYKLLRDKMTQFIGQLLKLNQMNISRSEKQIFLKLLPLY